MVAAGWLGPWVGRRKLEASEHGGEHGLHLHDGEGGADAAARPAAEGDERVWRRRALHEPLGPEVLGIGEGVAGGLCEHDRREYECAGGQTMTGDLSGCG